MNFENIGLNICKIISKDNQNKVTEIPICTTSREDRDKVDNTVNEIEIPSHTNDRLQHMPFNDKSKGINRQILYISGASGSGKSFYTAAYLKEYHKKYPKNPIFIFSSLTEDKTIDECKNVIRIDFKDESFYLADYSVIEKWKDCLVVYDDTEMIADPFVATKLKNLQDLILTTGRHTNTFCIVTSHVANARERTRLILIESFSITLFLDTMGYKNLSYALETGFGFKRSQIDMLKMIDSRWITIFRTSPITVMHEKGIFTMQK
jgi:hypothetical protein